MSVMIVPGLEEEPWPTLGGQVCEFIEAYVPHGPGDLRGAKATIDDEFRALLYRMYEVQPQFIDARKKERNPVAGRRRFRRVGISLRKGSAKTELAAWIAACELHPLGPVRCDGFDANGRPVGRGVRDPYIPMVAYTEEQTEDLAYAALYVMLSEGLLANDFDIGLERIMRIAGDGKATALASAPDARDGARTTFQHFDETHRFTLPRLKAAHKTMINNLPKRRASDAWALETTTAFTPGEGSVAEDTMTYARHVQDGKTQDSRLFFFHRQASESHDLMTREGRKAAVIEASGPKAAWSDIDGIVEIVDDPTADLAYWERMWLNRPVQGARQAFSAARWAELARPDYVVADGALITLGFDGSIYHDATGLVGTEIATGFQFVVGKWEPPPKSDPDADRWEVPATEVDATVIEAFRRWKVWRMLADPFWWETWVSRWAGLFGDKVVLEWRTNRIMPTAFAVKAYHNAIVAGDVTHDGDEALARHIGNACRKETNFRDDTGERLSVITKERPDSPFKIDLAMAAVASWAARGDAVASGVLQAPPPSVYDERAKTGGAVLRTL